MGPVNASLRFLYELVALYGIGAGLWNETRSIVVVLVVGVATAAVWGVFRVPDDPGPPPVAVTGALRLTIEAAVFGGGAVGLGAAHGPPPAIAFGVVVAVHYATTSDRLRHVLSFRRGPSS